ncbi:hypothetical protein PWP93_36575 [Paraburkholderia sp. A1RI-2L]|uniref:hypothetical protein n=1 Tax=Paraburkholderia sp. A1RI-2L TaxID=3028367 RepID=UPI003B764BFC
MKTQSKTIATMLAISAAFLLAACSKPADDVFIGTWQSPARKTEHIVIERNGDGFMIHDFAPSFFDGKPSERKLPAIYKDGVLQASTGMGTANFGHDAKNDTLTVQTLGGSLDFTRIK